MTAKIQWRRGLAADWETANTILAIAEAGYETDTGKLKMGDGSTAWHNLSYTIMTVAGSNTQIQFNNSQAVGADANLVFNTATARLTAPNVNCTSNAGLTLGIPSAIANGYSYLPNGLLLQWGTLLAANTTSTVTFPIAFPTACYSVVATAAATILVSANSLQIVTVNTTIAQVRSATTNVTSKAYWMAIGI